MDYYDVKIFQDRQSTNILSQISNSINLGLSQTMRLPSLIFLFMEDLIFTSGEIFLPSEIEVQLRWIFQQVDSSLKNRKRIMPTRAIRAQEPRTFIVKALPRYDFGKMRLPFSEFLYRQERYNTLLYQIGRCYGFGVMDVMSIDSNDLLCFDESGTGRQLSNRGKYHFWRELCQYVADFDKEKDKDNRKRILNEELNQREHNRHHFQASTRRY